MHEHNHTHPHTQTKQVLKRLNNIIGHMQGISGMVEEGRDCSDILIQLSAVNASIRKLKVIILKDHMEHCLVDAVKNDDKEILDKLNSALELVVSS